MSKLQTLQDSCIHFICQNENINLLKSKLSNLPHFLLFKMSPYLSPFGLHILQDYTKINVNALDKFWECFKLCPQRFLPKFHRFQEIKVLTNIENEEEEKAPYNKFLSNCFGLLIIDALHSSKNLDFLFSILLLTYLKYPKVGLEMKFRNNQSQINHWTLIQQLSNKISTLTVTVSSCNTISENMAMFFHLLKHVSQLTINLNSGSNETLDGLLDVIYFLRLFNLDTVQFTSSFGRFSLENCKVVWSAIYEKLEPNIYVDGLISDLTKQGKLNLDKRLKEFDDNSSENYDSCLLDNSDGLYDNVLIDPPSVKASESLIETKNEPSQKRQRLSEEVGVCQKRIAEDDLFNFALESFDETVDVDTNIDNLNISLSGNDIYNLSFVPALKKWGTLKSLSLTRVVVDESDFRLICQRLKHNLCELRLCDFDCFTHQEALKLLSLSKISLSHCETPPDFYRTLLNCEEEGEDDNILLSSSGVCKSINGINSDVCDTTGSSSNCNKSELKIDGIIPNNPNIIGDKIKLQNPANCSNCTSNAIDNNTLSTSSITFLPKSTRLEILEILGENILSHDLCRGLTQNKSLTALKIFCAFDFNECFLAELWTAVSCHPSLKALQIESLGRKSTGGAHLANCEEYPIRDVLKNPRLTQFSVKSLFHYRSIHELLVDEDTQTFYNSNLETFIWRDNDVDREGLLLLGKCLSDPKNFPKLKHLSLSCIYKPRDLKDFISLVHDTGRRRFARLSLDNEREGEFTDDFITDIREAKRWAVNSLRTICECLVISRGGSPVTVGTEDFISVM